MDNNLIEQIYHQLLNYYGPQSWWPGDTPFEIMLGAILTQNTSWQNVERAIDNLRPYLEPEKIYDMQDAQLSKLIKPSGFYNVKTKRIKNFLEWFKHKNFSIEELKKMDVQRLRQELLLINGIGRETADSIILYAIEKPIFVIDAYTRRMFNRFGLSLPKEYDLIQDLFQKNINKDVYVFNEYHALIVKHSKDFCRAKPLCDECFLNSICNFYILR
ncbi:MAG: endonuclease III domain-containing protein [Xylanivirga thermophila]|jgi:endonuclease III related protein|uniref:endonuclease III domain-containing protein n=1 Tax=Xylanivirga thermophila TaxID=2496273 RepID=UPI0039F54B4B